MTAVPFFFDKATLTRPSAMRRFSSSGVIIHRPSLLSFLMGKIARVPSIASGTEIPGCNGSPTFTKPPEFLST